ncbi:putative zinc finger MYM-type protein 1-like [Apostichopus japonicus]|uniref:Putative zinc finger MYM-type protein 1-like n=1 Tax=Stichopus japonicus TaxID=307972 RepID=A0A2G8KJ59_STIJA|nr:putative zinc finger MYM-type protein 1-like [Apostichopus japonicus]
MACHTRWACRVDACRVMKDRFPVVVRLLGEIGNEDNADRAVEAKGLLAQLDANFLMKLVVFSDILTKTSQLSNMLQSTDLDLAKAVELTETLISLLEDLRNNPVSFDILWGRIENTVEEQGFDIDMADPTQRKMKRRLPEHFRDSVMLESVGNLGRSADGDSDTMGTDVKDQIRVNFVYPALDRIISEMNRRFNKKSM